MFARWLTVVAGLWLVIAQSVLPANTSAVAAVNDFWTGLAVIAVGLFAARVGGLRFVNTGLGMWLLAAPFVLRYGAAASIVNDVMLGVVVIVLSLVPNEAGLQLEVRGRRTAES